VIQNHPHRTGTDLRAKFVRCLVHHDSSLLQSWSLQKSRGGSLQSLDAALSKGIADADVGRVHNADAVFDELLARLEALPNEPAIRRAQALVARHVPADAGLADEVIAERHAAADIE
jgi:hypothetical protein